RSLASACRACGIADNVVLDILSKRCKHAFDIVGRFKAEMLVHLFVHLPGCQRHVFVSCAARMFVMRHASHCKTFVSLAMLEREGRARTQSKSQASPPLRPLADLEMIRAKAGARPSRRALPSRQRAGAPPQAMGGAFERPRHARAGLRPFRGTRVLVGGN